MSRERDLLERFFFVAEPLSITLFGPDYSRPLGFGRSGARVARYQDVTSGFGQTHSEQAGVCVFTVGIGKWESLVAEFPFQDIGPTLHRSWLRFVHLATLFELAVDLGPSTDPLRQMHPCKTATAILVAPDRSREAESKR
jgi:hypothetical protein